MKNIIYYCYVIVMKVNFFKEKVYILKLKESFIHDLF